ncbi:MAG: XdhC/CoxI family protein [Candidatus Eisenbacteria bacterium]
MGTRETYLRLEEWLRTGPAATATVIRTRGSTPREVGAKMLVDASRTFGTIGGGCGEAEVVQLARTLLSEGNRRRGIVHIDLTESAWETSDRICGGTMDVLVETWPSPSPSPSPSDPTDAGQSVWTLLRRNDGFVRVVSLPEGTDRFWSPSTENVTSGVPTGELADRCDTAWRAGRSRIDELPSTTASESATARFFEVVSPRRTLIVCGAGHIAEPLVSMAAWLDLSVVVIDDRPDFACRERFPGASTILAQPFPEALSSLEITERTLAVLVTRGHRHDEACLRLLLDTRAQYIGMLGSRRRVRAIVGQLQSEGHAPDRLARVWAPIGLDLGADTPAEIAISILAEIVALLHRAADADDSGAERNVPEAAHRHLRERRHHHVTPPPPDGESPDHREGSADP